MTKKTWIKGSILAFALLLSACNGETEEKDTATKEKAVKTTEPAQQTEQKEEPAKEEVTSIEEEGTYNGQVDNNSIEVEAGGETLVLRLTDEVRDTVAQLEEGAKVSIVYKKNENEQWVLEEITATESTELSPTKILHYSVDGTEFKKEAALTESEQDYYFYKVEDFEFTAEEPRKDLMFATESGETIVRIEPLSEDASIDDLKKWANDELQAVGEVKEVNGVEIAGDAFASSPLFITASKESFTKYIVIHELKSGNKMKYTINLPQHKKTDEWEQVIWAMLSTLETK